MKPRGMGCPAIWAKRLANISFASTRMCWGLFCYVKHSVMWSQFSELA
jgi:hypothetical protein